MFYICWMRACVVCVRFTKESSCVRLPAQTHTHSQRRHPTQLTPDIALVAPCASTRNYMRIVRGSTSNEYNELPDTLHDYYVQYAHNRYTHRRTFRSCAVASRAAVHRVCDFRMMRRVVRSLLRFDEYVILFYLNIYIMYHGVLL